MAEAPAPRSEASVPRSEVAEGPRIELASTVLARPSVRPWTGEDVLDVLSYEPEDTLGGLAPDMFLNLSDNDKDKYRCNICLQVVWECRKCVNEHLFCAGCIYRWRRSGHDGSRRCPVCRTNGPVESCDDINAHLKNKMIKCPSKDCSWAGELVDYKFHKRSHQPTRILHAPRTLGGRLPTSLEETELLHAMADGRTSIQQDLEVIQRELAEGRARLEGDDDDDDDVESGQVVLGNLTTRLHELQDRVVTFIDQLSGSSQRYHELMYDEWEDRVRSMGGSAASIAADAADEGDTHRLSNNWYLRAMRQQDQEDQGRLARLMLDDEDENTADDDYYFSADDRARVDTLLTQDTPGNPFTST